MSVSCILAFVPTDDDRSRWATEGVEQRRAARSRLEERLERVRQGLVDDEDPEEPRERLTDDLVLALEAERFSNEVLSYLRLGVRLWDAWAVALCGCGEVRARHDSKDCHESDLGLEDLPAGYEGPAPVAPGPRPLEMRVFGPEGGLHQAEWDPKRKAIAEADAEAIRDRSRRFHAKRGTTPENAEQMRQERARERHFRESRKNRQENGWSPRRTHPPAKVDDVFATWTVFELLKADLTSNERVKVRCENGHERVAYVFNLRREPRCSRCPRGPQKVTTNGVHHMPPWVASPSSKTSETALGNVGGPSRGSAPERPTGSMVIAEGETLASGQGSEEPDPREGQEVIDSVLAAVKKLGFGTGGMIAYEADLPAAQALAVLGALEVDGKIKATKLGGSRRWRLA